MWKTSVHNVRDLILMQAAKYGDREYLVVKDQSFSFAKLDRRSRQVARGFSQLGVKKGDRVAIVIGNRPAFIFVWWGLIRIGAVMVPVNLKLTGGEIADIINHAEAKAVVLGELFGQSMQMLKTQCPTVEHWICVRKNGAEPSVEAFFERWDDPPDIDVPILVDDPASILYTSGTTGFPKGVIHTHGNYLFTADSFARTIRLSPQDRLLTANALFHVNAQFYSCMGTLAAGATFILAEKFSASQLWSWTRRYRVNKLVLLLPLATILYNCPPLSDDADNPVELVVAGGVPTGCYEDFQERFGVRLQTLYSLTEAPLAVMSPPDVPCRAGAVGLPMITDDDVQNEIRIVNEHLETVPVGETGEIVIRNPALIKAYLKNPEATAEALVDGWLRTGDRGAMDADGWIRFLGRAKDVIRKKGENISAVQVEHNQSPAAAGEGPACPGSGGR
jgi:carnitine-CoA ligase